MTDPTSAGLDPHAFARLDARIQKDIDDGENLGASILVARGGTIGHRATFGTVAELTFIFLSAGFLDGLDHFTHLRRLSDLALAACG